MSLLSLEPKPLWKHFQTLCDIPRPSKHEEQLIASITAWADGLVVEWERDQVGNLVLRKPATPGHENSPAVVLQSHLDMVAQKSDASTHDFFKDAIQPQVEDGWVTAQGTTLGADNGIGVAAILAVFEESSLVHGPLEALLTVDEEAGMSGAKGLKGGFLKGDILLNLDTEEVGELYVGCAGGEDLNARFPLEMEAVHSDVKAYKLTVQGLKGGHSGIDIHKPLANGIKVLSRLLDFALRYNVRVAELQAGTLRNALCRHAEAVILLEAQQEKQVITEIKKLADDLAEYYRDAEPHIEIHFTEIEPPARMWSEHFSGRVIASLLACPHGVERMSCDFANVVETSTNLAKVQQSEWYLDIQCLTRSMTDIGRDGLQASIRSVFELAGAKVGLDNAYPGWKPESKSRLLTLMQSVHKDCFGKEAKIQVIHAGLECGILGASYPNWEMISFGPTITGAHSPDEKVFIESVQAFWKYLLASLQTLASVENI